MKQLNIDLVITSCLELAEAFEEAADNFDESLYLDDTEVCNEHIADLKANAAEQRQIAEWLEELKSLRAALEDDLK